MLSLLLSLSALSTSAVACGPAGRWHGHTKRDHGLDLDRRQSEASQAAIADPTAECKAYGFAPVTELQKSYPTIWDHATIPSSDSDATALFAALNSSIPNIAPRGTSDGDFTGVKYPSSDPDCWWTYGKCTHPKIANIPDDVTECPAPNTFGYTFDDGPNCSHNAMYDYLAAKKQKATLFYIGSNVLDWPLEAQRGLADGHELCAHTWSHPYMTSMSNEQAFAELYYSKKAIKDVVGVTVQCWRPPFGDVDDRIRYIADALGMQTVVWVEDTFDWNYAAVGVSAVEKNYDNIIEMGKNGTFKKNGPIVLSHELDNTTMSLAVQFYPQLASAYKNVVPVNVCHNNTAPYVEKDVIYPNLGQWAAGTRTVSLVSPTVTNAAINSGMPISTGAQGSVLPKMDYNSPSSSQPTGGSSGSSGSGSSGSGSSSGLSGSSSSSSDPSTDSSTESSAAIRGASFVLGRGEFVGMASTAAGVMAGWGWIAALL